MVACTFKESWLGASGGPGVTPLPSPPFNFILNFWRLSLCRGSRLGQSGGARLLGSPRRCEDSMLESLLAFCCLFVFNCRLDAKSVALGGSRRVQRGRETRLRPGPEVRGRPRGATAGSRAGSRGLPRGAGPRFTAPRSRGSGCRLPAGSAPRKPDAFAGFPDTPCKTGSQASPRLQDL